MPSSESKWYIDSGATVHMCNNVKSFNKSTVQLPAKSKIQIGVGMELDVLHEGTVAGTITSYGKTFPVLFKDFLYVPKLQFNLLSVSKIRKKGYTISFTSDAHGTGLCKVIDNQSNTVAMTGFQVYNGLYEVIMKAKNTSEH